jgi:hypothetical protein
VEISSLIKEIFGESPFVIDSTQNINKEVLILRDNYLDYIPK